MKTCRILTFFFTIALSLVAQEAKAPASVVVTGFVKEPLTLTVETLANMPRATVRTKNNGIEIVYEGVWLHDILKRSGVPQGSELRGKALTTYVLAEASDGYQVVFSASELDPGFTDNEILVADKADGKPLFGRDGSFRLVAPKDKVGARSVRMLIKLEIGQVKK